MIGFWGGMALLISSITGPGLTTSLLPCSNSQCAANTRSSSSSIPGGWVVYVGLPVLILRVVANVWLLRPTLAFLVFGVIAGVVSLFLVETMSAIQGNESFQSRVEYATVAHLYLGDKPHLAMQILLYCALQSVNLSSIIISEQVRAVPA